MIRKHNHLKCRTSLPLYVCALHSPPTIKRSLTISKHSPSERMTVAAAAHASMSYTARLPPHPVSVSPHLSTQISADTSSMGPNARADGTRRNNKWDSLILELLSLYVFLSSRQCFLVSSDEQLASKIRGRARPGRDVSAPDGQLSLRLAGSAWGHCLFGQQDSGPV